MCLSCNAQERRQNNRLFLKSETTCEKPRANKYGEKNRGKKLDIKLKELKIVGRYADGTRHAPADRHG